VKGTLGSARFTTGVVHKTLAPKWEREVYELPIEDWMREESYTLKLRVRDYDKFSSDDELGSCQIDLRSMRGGLSQTVWQDLQGWTRALSVSASLSRTTSVCLLRSATS